MGREGVPARRVLLAIVLVALVVRVAVAALPIVHHEDEIWQYLEPAYGAVTGRWIETWDIREGIRSWLMPVLLMPGVALGHALAPRSGLHVLLSREWLALASLAVVWAFWSLGARIGPRHALVAALVAAIWPEIVYFAPRTSVDGLALTLLLPAFALLYAAERSLWRDALVGLLCALAVMLRLQLAPAVAVVVLGRLWGQPRRWVPLLLGGALGLLADAGANLAMGEAPFAWVWANFAVNLVEGRSAIFGTAPPWWYGERLLDGWRVAALLLIPAIVAGARRYPLLLAAALVEIAVMAVIPHKEYRFITVVVGLLVLLGAIGSVGLGDRVAQRWLGQDRIGLPPLAGVWLLLSLMVGTSPTFLEYWGQGVAPSRALLRAGAVPGLCGVAVYRHPAVPVPSYVLLNRAVPVLMIDDWLADKTRHPPMLASAYDAAIAPGTAQAELARGHFRQVSCGASLYPYDPQHWCVYVRPGGCTRAPQWALYNEGLKRIGR